MLKPGHLTTEYKLAVRWSIGTAVAVVVGIALVPFAPTVGAWLFWFGAISGTVIIGLYNHDRASLKAATPPSTKRVV